VKLTTKQNDDLAVRRGKDKEGQFVELQTEDSQHNQNRRRRGSEQAEGRD